MVEQILPVALHDQQRVLVVMEVEVGHVGLAVFQHLLVGGALVGLRGVLAFGEAAQS